jgi:hypothetical protein
VASANVTIKVSPKELRVIVAALSWYRAVALRTKREGSPPYSELGDVGKRFVELAKGPLQVDPRAVALIAGQLIENFTS